MDEHGLSWDWMAVATGKDFPDALAGGVLQGAYSAPLLLTPGTSLSAGVADILHDNRADIYYVHVLGGTAAVSPTVRDQMTDALK